MPMPTVVGVSAAHVSSATAPITPAFPSGYTAVADDIAVTFCETTNVDTVTPPSGWAAITSIAVSTGTVTKLWAIWRRIQAGDTAPTIGSGDPGDHIIGRMIIIRGCVNTGNPWDATATSTELTSDTSVSIPGVNTIVPNCLVLAAFSTGQDVNSTANASAWSNINLASFFEQMDNWTNAGGGGGFAVVAGEKATAGATGNTTATVGTANFKALMTIALKGSSGITATVNQTTETDTSQPVAKQKIKATGQLTETDTAQPISRQKITVIGQPQETDTAQAITRQKILVVGQATETDTAQIIATGGPTTIPVNQTVEIDSAQPISRQKIRTLGQVTETNTAQLVTSIKTKLLGQPTETDTAQIVTEQKIRTLGQVTETDTAQPITTPAETIVPVNQVTETDTAQAIVRQKLMTIGQAVEADTANSVTRPGRINQVVETDTAQPITEVKSRTLGQPTETSTAQPISKRKLMTIGQAIETDTALTITMPGRLGQAVETDSAQSVTRLKVKAIGQALESNTVFNLNKLKLRSVNQAIETDTAQFVTSPSHVVGPHDIEVNIYTGILAETAKADIVIDLRR